MRLAHTVLMATAKSGRAKSSKAARKAARTGRRVASARRRRETGAGSRGKDALVRMLRPLVRDLVADELEDRLDVVESLRALEDPRRVTHEDLVRELGS